MTNVIIGRPLVPTKTDASKLVEIFAIFIGSFVLPAFVAELARLYFEQEGREVYNYDPRAPHVVLCGDINTSRLRAFMAQFFHKSRDPELLSPMVVLAEHKYEGALKMLIEQSSYTGSVKYLRGSARRPGDLLRAGIVNASTLIVLAHRTNDVESAAADADITATSLTAKNLNRGVRILAQLRRPKGREHLLCLPGWVGSDRAVAVSSLSMTLLGVGCLIPGLPTLLTNLIHQGNKSNARSSNPRRRRYLSAHTRRLGLDLGPQAAGMIVANTTPWWALPVSATLGVLDFVGTMVLTGGGAAPPPVSQEDLLCTLTKPMSVMEEYTSGFAQEMYAFAVTPGLVGISFSAAARILYLRYGVLLLGVKAPTAAAPAVGSLILKKLYLTYTTLKYTCQANQTSNLSPWWFVMTSVVFFKVLLVNKFRSNLISKNKQLREAVSTTNSLLESKYWMVVTVRMKHRYLKLLYFTVALFNQLITVAWSTNLLKLSKYL
jgi:hypothetical protein